MSLKLIVVEMLSTHKKNVPFLKLLKNDIKLNASCEECHRNE